MYLFVDTETSGLSTQTSRSVQIAWILADARGGELVQRSQIIRPDGFEIEPGAARVHGISQSKANLEGIPIREVLSSLQEALDVAEVLVGHNIQFDVAILENDIRAAKVGLSLHDLPKICTMRASTAWCRISKLNGKKGFKWPTLAELHRRCFGHEFEGAHDALSDVQATKRCFFKLVELGVIAPPAPRDQPAKPKAQIRYETGCPYCRLLLKLPLGVRGRATCPSCRQSFYVNRTFTVSARKDGVPQERSKSGQIMRRVPCGCCAQTLRIPHNCRGLATCPKCDMKTLFKAGEW